MAADRPAAQALRDPLTVSPSSMVHPGRAVADVGEAFRTAVGEVRSSLTEAFGVALLSVEPVADPARRIVRLEGTVASAHVAARVVEATLANATGWSIDARMLTPVGTDRWRRLPPGATAVWSCPGDRGRRPTLTSQLLPDDGPVEVLHRAGQGTLVRTARGTLGWVRGPLGSMAPPPVGSRPRARVPLATVATAWLDVPYRLGGTLPTGIDCSGLVMRCFTAAWGVPLPRHSTDQVQSELLTERDARTDDLVLLRDGVGRAHVGLVVAHTGDGPLVVHASARRGRVVAEPLGSLAAAACDVRLAAATDLIELHG